MRGHNRATRIGAHRDRGVIELGYEFAHGIVQGDSSFLHERHHGNARQRLRLRSDAEDCVRCHPTLRFPVGPAECALVDRLSVSQDECYGPADLAAVNGALQRRIDSR
jgi:hypothetical protein